jgi:hypothetical protein
MQMRGSRESSKPPVVATMWRLAGFGKNKRAVEVPIYKQTEKSVWVANKVWDGWVIRRRLIESSWDKLFPTKRAAWAHALHHAEVRQEQAADEVERALAHYQKITRLMEADLDETD